MYQKEYWERKSLDHRRRPDHPVVRQYVSPKIDFIRKTIFIDSQTKLLDVGCGNGFFSFYFNPLCEVVGVDFSAKMLAMNPISKKCVMDAAHLNFQDLAFEVVFCHALLHHVANIDEVIKEMRRVSNKYVVILEPNRNNPLMYLFSSWVPEERKALKFSMGYLRGKIAENGLKVVSSGCFGMTVPNKTPAFLLPLIKFFDFQQPLGMTNILIAER